AAVLLGHLDTEDAQLAELVVEVARRDARRVPLVVYRHHLRLDERADGLPESLVVLVENGAPQRFLLSHERVDAGERAPDQQLLNLAGALVQRGHPRIAQ